MVQMNIIETSEGGLRGGVPSMSGQGIAVIMPSTDLSMAVRAAQRMGVFAGLGCRLVVVMDEVRQGFIATVNQAAKAMRPEYVAYVAQDALAGRDWLKLALARIQREDKGVCSFNDGVHQGGLAQFALVRTSFTSVQYGEGNIFYPGYHTHRADEDLTHLANRLGQYTYAPEAILMEADFRLQRKINQVDIDLFIRRKNKIYDDTPMPA